MKKYKLPLAAQLAIDDARHGNFTKINNLINTYKFTAKRSTPNAPRVTRIWQTSMFVYYTYLYETLISFRKAIKQDRNLRYGKSGISRNSRKCKTRRSSKLSKVLDK